MINPANLANALKTKLKTLAGSGNFIEQNGHFSIFEAYYEFAGNTYRIVAEVDTLAACISSFEVFHRVAGSDGPLDLRRNHKNTPNAVYRNAIAIYVSINEALKQHVTEKLASEARPIKARKESQCGTAWPASRTCMTGLKVLPMLPLMHLPVRCRDDCRAAETPIADLAFPSFYYL